MITTNTNNPGISPAAFLHCLRENHVLLTIEEEAALLDCLDIERLAERGGAKARAVPRVSRRVRASALVDTQGGGLGEEGEASGPGQGPGYDEGYRRRQDNNTAITHLPQDRMLGEDNQNSYHDVADIDMPLIYYKRWVNVGNM